MDKDHKSNFYFNVEQYKIEKLVLLFLIDFAPINKFVVTNTRIWIRSEELDKYFNNWVEKKELSC